MERSVKGALYSKGRSVGPSGKRNSPRSAPRYPLPAVGMVEEGQSLQLLANGSQPVHSPESPKLLFFTIIIVVVVNTITSSSPPPSTEV
jgi:hypothetical protein